MPDQIVRDGKGQPLGRVYETVSGTRMMRDMNGKLLGSEDTRGVTRNEVGQKVGEHVLGSLINQVKG